MTNPKNMTDRELLLKIFHDVEDLKNYLIPKEVLDVQEKARDALTIAESLQEQIKEKMLLQKQD